MGSDTVNKTLYVPDDKRDLWKRAERTAVLQGYKGISGLIVALLQKTALTTEELERVDKLVRPNESNNDNSE